ncbi:hypothetical protein PX699_00335 [Sphingobium sp. H39-3-25]|uniref:hypothetical protein n=1 Tax=Sphingobium arseniciresistens TaxID=3030834 RepID=UPI0023BA2121|nr:hypothetical protein [Sphingobium arseniciresistens]
MRHLAILLGALPFLFAMPALADAPKTLTIYVMPDTICPNDAFGRARVKIAQFEAQKAARKARREGYKVRIVTEQPMEPYRGNLRTSEGLPTSIPVFTPLC